MKAPKQKACSDAPYSRVVAGAEEDEGHSYPEPAADRPGSCLDWRSPSFYRVAFTLCLLALVLAVNLVAISRLTALIRQQLRLSHSLPRPAQQLASFTAPSNATAALTAPPRFRLAVYSVGLGVSYFQLALDFVASGQRHLCAGRPDVQVDYFVFTNHGWADAEGGWANWQERDVDASNVHLLPAVKRGWPYDSDLRYEFMDNHTDDMAAEVQRRGSAAFAASPVPFTHFVWSDADNHFAAPICEELLGELVATQHPHLFSGCAADSYPYELRPESRAYVPPSMQRLFPYFTAHLYAATAARFKHLISTLAANTRIDRAKGIQAKVDDESHLQAYLIDHIPTAVLSRAFVWPEGKDNYDDDARHMLDLGRLGGMRCVSAHSSLKKRTED